LAGSLTVTSSVVPRRKSSIRKYAS
jgi:hypothetical protein